MFEVCPLCQEWFKQPRPFLSRFRTKKKFQINMNNLPLWMKDCLKDHPFGKYNGTKVCSKCHKLLSEWKIEILTIMLVEELKMRGL